MYSNYFMLLNNRNVDSYIYIIIDYFYLCQISKATYHSTDCSVLWSPEQENMASSKITSKVELRKTSRMTTQAEATIPPTEQGV